MVAQKGKVVRKISNKIKITGPNNFEKIYEIGPNATKEIANQMTEDFADYIQARPGLPRN